MTQIRTLSAEAQEGLDYAVEHLKANLALGKSPEQCLTQLGITSLADTYIFLGYLKSHYPHLYRKMS